MRQLCFAAAVLFMTMFVTSAAASDSEERLIVMIVPDGQEGLAGAMIRAVTGQLSGLPVILRLHSVPVYPGDPDGRIALSRRVVLEHNAAAVFWCDLETGSEIFFFISTSQGDRTYTRLIEDPGDRGSTESLAIITRMTIQEILAGTQIGVAASRPVAPVEPEEIKEPDNEVHFLDLRVGFDLAMQADGPIFSQGMALDVIMLFESGFGLLAGYDVLSTIRNSSDEASMSVKRHPAHLGVHYRLGHGVMRVAFALAFFLDFITIEQHNLAEDLVPDDDTDDLVCGLMPSVTLYSIFRNRIGLFLSVAGRIPFKDLQYVAETSEGRQVLIDFWPIQPRLVAGMVVEFL